jgi:hypothetical protein
MNGILGYVSIVLALVCVAISHRARLALLTTTNEPALHVAYKVNNAATSGAHVLTLLAILCLA